MSHREKEIKTITHCLFVLKEFIITFMVCWLLFMIDFNIVMTLSLSIYTEVGWGYKR